MSVVLQESAQQWEGGLQEVRRCPVCDDPRRAKELDDLRDTAFGAAPGTWSLKRCLGCRAMYLDPRPDPASIHLAYRTYYTHVSTKVRTRRGLAWLKHALANGYRNRVYRTSLRPSLAIGGLLTPLLTAATADHIRHEARGLARREALHGRVLDVGCGNGHFLQVARRLGWLAYGVETDAAAVAAAREHGCEILGSQLADLGPSYDQLFDVIMLSHVIEHVHAPVETLRHCWRLVKPGGYVWIETPNIDSMGYETYGRHWRGLEPPRHLVLFSSNSLRSCLERAGFERIRTLPPRDVAKTLFTLSAALQLGRIAERDKSPLPREVLEQVKVAAERARSVVGHHPDRAEFVAAVAYRPESPRG